jgi:hypothetical protein
MTVISIALVADGGLMCVSRMPSLDQVHAVGHEIEPNLDSLMIGPGW